MPEDAKNLMKGGAANARRIDMFFGASDDGNE